MTITQPQLGRILDAESMVGIMERGADDTVEKLHEHYRKLPEDWFDSTKPNFPDGTPKHGRGRTFMRALSTDWEVGRVGRSSFSLVFQRTREGGSPWGLRMQEYGGTIRPKRSRSLAIPLTAEARGRRAAEFSATVHPLFAVRRKEGDGKGGTLVWKDAGGKLHAAYALRKSVTLKPLIKRRRHHGVPTEYQLRRMAAPAIREAVADLLKKQGK